MRKHKAGPRVSRPQQQRGNLVGAVDPEFQLLRAELTHLARSNSSHSADPTDAATI
jgi:hypothetical protein